MYPLFGSPLLVAPLEFVSRCLFHFDAAELEWTADGRLVALSGHAGVFSRGATLANVTDSRGVNYTAVNSQLAIEARDLDADGIREAIGVRMAGSDRLAFDDPPAPQAFSSRLAFVETGARGSANSTLAAIANDAVTGARVWIDTSGSYYRANFSDGTTTRTATLSAGQPTSGQHVELIVTLSDAGVLTIKQSINGAAQSTATAAALALPTAWGAGARVRLNSRGSSANPAQGFYRSFKIVPTVVDDSVLRGLR